ncbi:hypothetical protein PMAYCL1PPCAC_30929, partial [Pristionchus mayeri]
VLPQPNPGTGFEFSTACTDAEDVVDVLIGVTPPCPSGMTAAGKQPYIVDVVLPDGQRDVYPSQRSSIEWDSDVG